MPVLPSQPATVHTGLPPRHISGSAEAGPSSYRSVFSLAHISKHHSSYVYVPLLLLPPSTPPPPPPPPISLSLSLSLCLSAALRAIPGSCSLSIFPGFTWPWWIRARKAAACRSSSISLIRKKERKKKEKKGRKKEEEKKGGKRTAQNIHVYMSLSCTRLQHSTEQIDWRAKQPLQVVCCVSEELKC